MGFHRVVVVDGRFVSLPHDELGVVNRGGGWNNNAENCRPANRNDNNLTNRNNKWVSVSPLLPSSSRTKSDDYH